MPYTNPELKREALNRPIAGRVSLTCAYCKERFWAFPSRVKRKRYCSKACMNANRRVIHSSEEMRETRRAYQRRHYEKKMREGAHTYIWRKNMMFRRRHPDYPFEYRLTRLGLTMAEYKAILAKQKGACAICGYAPEKTRLSVDHDHATGKPRGLLCRHCNTGIGLLRDNPALLRRAIDYLLKYREAAPLLA